MGGRVAGGLRKELIDEPLTGTEAETTVYDLQLILSDTLNAVINKNSRD